MAKKTEELDHVAELPEREEPPTFETPLEFPVEMPEAE